jgi:hypothetical protein
MNQQRRLSICYLVPGHDLLASVGPSRNVLNLAGALNRYADVTIAFRRVADATSPPDLRVLEIQPGAAAATMDDAAMRAVSIKDFLMFMAALRRFVRTELGSFDVILEKNWLLSGYVSSICRRRGQLGVPIENIVPNPSHAARRQQMKSLDRRPVAATRAIDHCRNAIPEKGDQRLLEGPGGAHRSRGPRRGPQVVLSRRSGRRSPEARYPR